MRSRLAVILALLTALAVPTAASAQARLSMERPGAAALGLRGAEENRQVAGSAAGETTVGAESPAASAPVDLGLRPLAGPVLMSTPRVPDALACRTTCAQSYYFCLAGDGSDECAQVWGQCRLGCGPGAAGPAA
jgi:hypothetical protein